MLVEVLVEVLAARPAVEASDLVLDSGSDLVLDSASDLVLDSASDLVLDSASAMELDLELVLGSAELCREHKSSLG